jgi:hypothetical protein
MSSLHEAARKAAELHRRLCKYLDEDQWRGIVALKPLGVGADVQARGGHKWLR